MSLKRWQGAITIATNSMEQHQQRRLKRLSSDGVDSTQTPSRKRCCLEMYPPSLCEFETVFPSLHLLNYCVFWIDCSSFLPFFIYSFLSMFEKVFCFSLSFFLCIHNSCFLFFLLFSTIFPSLSFLCFSSWMPTSPNNRYGLKVVSWSMDLGSLSWTSFRRFKNKQLTYS